jgi:hypothetical protein
MNKSSKIPARARPRLRRLCASARPHRRDAEPALRDGARVGVSPHESAHLHVAGQATYIDDIPELAGTLHAALGLSPVAHGADQVSMSLDKIRALPGVVDVFTAADIPGVNDCGPIVHDDPILADGEVQYVGQPVFAVIAPTATSRAARPRRPRTCWRSSRCRRFITRARRTPRPVRAAADAPGARRRRREGRDRAAPHR